MPHLPDLYGSHFIWGLCRIIEIVIHHLFYTKKTDFWFFLLGAISSIVFLLYYKKGSRNNLILKISPDTIAEVAEYNRLRRLVLDDLTAKRLISFELDRGAPSRILAIKRAADKLIYDRTRR